ncbi:hypothetical protein GCM10023172_30250 [Hymenobacter ginsengisoli]|uniref:Uncharacterized protein n=1 Tax=Hymenobacter ginsengisoli TaxID=1051626 RepID=A0ABP8QJ13_9BACT|nr:MULTISPECIES: hypothetical protein [unclassified Hymenobacter]
MGELGAGEYDQLGPEEVKKHFPSYHTHTYANAAGAESVAECI